MNKKKSNTFQKDGDDFVKDLEQLSLNAYNNHNSTSQNVTLQMNPLLNEWITLNVGGKYFTTTRMTLIASNPDSMLARMFDKNSNWNHSMDSRGAILIDRSPDYFEPILNYLRTGELFINNGLNYKGVLSEARFYGVAAIVDLLVKKLESDNLEDKPDEQPFNRREFLKMIIGTPSSWELRCQGINLEGCNLSKLDLRHINFKYANLKKADLSMANVSNCNFERTDMTGVKMDQATVLSVRMLCVNLESASMKGCNFEDPAGNNTSMEGANMKGVNLEGSRMAGINLRVANLKNANLQNCDLRGAVLAGTDLENCNLSGCDLQEANLRGANLKGATFELMLNPLHMSQAVR